MGQYSWAIPIMQYGSQWRNCRKLFHEFMNVRAVTNFDDYQRKHTHGLLLHLAESPDNFLDHIELYVLHKIVCRGSNLLCS